MLRRRVSMTSYVGRCRHCNRAIVGEGRMSIVEYFELTYSGVVKEAGSLIKRVVWHRKCFGKDSE